MERRSKVRCSVFIPVFFHHDPSVPERKEKVIFIKKLYCYHSFVSMKLALIWASSQENLYSGFPTR